MCRHVEPAALLTLGLEELRVHQSSQVAPASVLRDVRVFLVHAVVHPEPLCGVKQGENGPVRDPQPLNLRFEQPPKAFGLPDAPEEPLRLAEVRRRMNRTQGRVSRSGCQAPAPTSASTS